MVVLETCLVDGHHQGRGCAAGAPAGQRVDQVEDLEGPDGAIFNPVADCGCFGEAFLLTNWHTFFKNVVLFAAAAFLLKKPRRIQTLYSVNGRWLPAILAVSGIIIFTIANQIYLPMVDFRPFKVGKSLRELTQVPAGAPEDVYEYVFVYEKNGKRQEFDMDHLPDESWTYLDRHEKLASQTSTQALI